MFFINKLKVIVGGEVFMFLTVKFSLFSSIFGFCGKSYTQRVPRDHHGGPAGVRGVGVGDQGARLHRVQLCGFGRFHRVRGGGLAGFVGELGNGVDGGVLGGVVALHVLRVHGGGVAGGGRVVIHTAARARGVLRS